MDHGTLYACQRACCTNQDREDGEGTLSGLFQRTAGFLTKTSEILEAGEQDKTLEELEAENRALYEELFSENYGTCYGNPAYAAERLGEYGKAFTFYMQSFGAALPMHLKKKVVGFYCGF